MPLLRSGLNKQVLCSKISRARSRALQASASSEFTTSKKWLEKCGRKSIEEIRKLRLITAIKTPYLPNGRIDLFSYDRLVEEQIQGGVQGLVVGGTTGEGHLMSWDEHIMLIAHTAHRFGEHLCVIGNTGSNSTREAVHATCQGFAVGMDAALHINPYYGKTSRQGLLQHFRSVLDYGPTIIYNVPARTAQDITEDIIFSLATHHNFAGIKECTGNKRIAAYSEQGITCWSGNDDESHDARYDAGAVGVISVTSNLTPSLMHKLMFGGKNETLREELLPLMDWLFMEPNPTGLNTALSMTQSVQPVFRLPYAPYDDVMREKGVDILLRIGPENLVGTGMHKLHAKDFILLSSF
mmetsp:Transcript_6123/g.21505  ORF Transcript_6123/g.21505 Transcript_6123/m.21505 type:complete len:353 (+) Transcript_6123:187-1245(+)